ncbi:uncharacterized protein PRCAT00006294001 [Priceomyces carsonii]|uniref:uncharacterized protein n=1 Tax=Priceomyces carsonii TaxID=28549 RepID=UPI002ED9A061|nr:unnamed protein product [Priceomyces carsonii]
MWIIQSEEDDLGKIILDYVKEIISFSSANSFIVTSLESNHTYNFGRADDNDFILRSQASSRHQFSIVIGSIGDTKVDNSSKITPLQIEFKSRAKTIVNGEVYRLSKKSTSNIKKDLTSFSNIKIEVPKTSYKDSTDDSRAVESNITWSISWHDFNVLAYSGDGASNKGLKSSDTLVNDLKEIQNSGIDVRITKDPLIATHYCTSTDAPTEALKMSILRAIPILNESWLSYIRENIKNVDDWFVHLDPRRFLPMSKYELNNIYLVPNVMRCKLFEGVVVVSFDKHLNGDYSWIEAASGTTFMFKKSDIFRDGAIENEKLKEILESRFAQKRFILLKTDPDDKGNDKFNVSMDACLSLMGSQLVEESILFHSLVDCSRSKIETFSFVFHDYQRRKRRKYEKINKMDLLDFSSPQPTQNNAERIEETSEEPSEKPGEKPSEKPNEKPAANDQTVESHNPELNISQEALGSSDTTVGRHVESHRLAGDLHQKEFNENEKRQNAEDNRHDIKRQKTLKNTTTTFVDAIKEAKKIATQNMSDQLGTDDGKSLLVNDLKDLTVVEIVPMRLRHAPKTATKDYGQGRKNFKRFKKQTKDNRAPKEYVQLKPSYFENNYDSFSHPMNRITGVEERLENDFRGEMDEVRGLKESKIRSNTASFDGSQTENSENGLFIPEDESQEMPASLDRSTTIGQNTNRSKVTNKHDDQDNDDDDDDDDDDYDIQPRFGFSRTDAKSI